MSKDEKATPAEAPKKSKKKLMIIVIAAVVLLGGGGGAFFMLKGSSASAAPKEPTKGAVVTMDSALTINLADGHYLKLAFTIQETTDASGHETIDNSEAIDLAIAEYTGMDVATLEMEKGREASKAALLAAIEKAYNEKGTQIVMDIYYTQFVTQ